MVVNVLLDTGCRIDEVLKLLAKNVDLESLSLKVMGKGTENGAFRFRWSCGRCCSASSRLARRRKLRARTSSRHSFRDGSANILMDNQPGVTYQLRELTVTVPEESSARKTK